MHLIDMPILLPLNNHFNQSHNKGINLNDNSYASVTAWPTQGYISLQWYKKQKLEMKNRAADSPKVRSFSAFGKTKVDVQICK